MLDFFLTLPFLLLPAIIFNSVLCKWYPVYGNHFTMILAACVGFVVAKCIWKESEDPSRVSPHKQRQRLKKGYILGCITAVTLALPVLLKVIIALDKYNGVID